MIWDFGGRPLPVRDHMVSIKGGPWLSKVWRPLVCRSFLPPTFLPPTFHRSSSVTHGLAKILTFYFGTKDRPLSKPHGP